MKIRKIIPMLLTLPLLVGCGEEKKPDPKPSELVIPTVDVDSITPELPDKPNYGGEIKTDGTYDYLDFYELSDMHGAVNEGSKEIGLAKLASYLNIKRESNPGGTVIVSSGDMFQGSVESNSTRGYLVNYAMNYMGFDAMAVGNHEFDWTDTWLKKNANLEYKGHKIPFISANIVEKSSKNTPDFLSKSTIVERGGYKIGIVGSIGQTLTSSILASCVENYEFTNEAEAVNAEAARLKETEHCDFVLLASHNQISNLQSVGLKNVDAIFGGHQHKDDSADIDGSIPAVQTANYGQSIAHIQLKIEKASKSVSSFCKEYDAGPLKLAGLKADENVNKIINNYSAKINEIKNIKLGSSDSLLKHNGALKGICVEAMYQGALKGIKEANLNIAESDIIATFHNVEKGIRDDIEKGEINYGSVYTPFPFDNDIVLFQISGSKFLNNTSKYSSLACRRLIEKREDVDKSKQYYIVLTDYIALSDNYLQSALGITEDKLIRTGKVVRDEVANLIYKKENIVGSQYDNVAPYLNIDNNF